MKFLKLILAMLFIADLIAWHLSKNSNFGIWAIIALQLIALIDYKTDKEVHNDR